MTIEKLLAEDHKLVNRNIGKIMQEKKLRQCRVEDAAGMKRGTVCRIIAGKRKVYADEVVTIAMALGVGIEELFAEQSAAS